VVEVSTYHLLSPYLYRLAGFSPLWRLSPHWNHIVFFFPWVSYVPILPPLSWFFLFVVRSSIFFPLPPLYRVHWNPSFCQSFFLFFSKVCQRAFLLELLNILLVFPFSVFSFLSFLNGWVLFVPPPSVLPYQCKIGTVLCSRFPFSCPSPFFSFDLLFFALSMRRPPSSFFPFFVSSFSLSPTPPWMDSLFLLCRESLQSYIILGKLPFPSKVFPSPYAACRSYPFCSQLFSILLSFLLRVFFFFS